jgi:hypothetical protein
LKRGKLDDESPDAGSEVLRSSGWITSKAGVEKGESRGIADVQRFLLSTHGRSTLLIHRPARHQYPMISCFFPTRIFTTETQCGIRRNPKKEFKTETRKHGEERN